MATLTIPRHIFNSITHIFFRIAGSRTLPSKIKKDGDDYLAILSFKNESNEKVSFTEITVHNAKNNELISTKTIAEVTAYPGDSITITYKMKETDLEQP